MGDSFTQLHIQLIFAVKYREALINRVWKERLHQYISATIQNDRHKMLEINSMPDHIHFFIGLRPHQSISSLVQTVKKASNNWINENNFLKSKFAWQEGYGAFSYAKSQVHDVVTYIKNQEIHHQKETFLDEYRKFLTRFEVEWDEQYIFKEPE